MPHAMTEADFYTTAMRYTEINEAWAEAAFMRIMTILMRQYGWAWVFFGDEVEFMPPIRDWSVH